MKQISIIVTLCCMLSLSAWELKLFPTLIVNLTDQANFVLPARPLHITTVSRVEKGQPFNVNGALILKKPLKQSLKLSGCFTVTAPDNRTIATINWDDPVIIPARARGIIILPRYSRHSFEEADKFGKYRFTLTLKDDTGKAQSVSSSIELVNSITDFKMMDAAEFNKFLQNYYRSPKPERLLAALNYFLSEGIIELRHRKKRFDARPLLTAFAEAFKRNPQFYDELIKIGGTEPPADQYLALLFSAIGKDFLKKNAKKINPHILQQISRFKTDPMSTAAINNPTHLDMLWAKFYINGNFREIKQLNYELRKRSVMPAKMIRQAAASGKKLSENDKEKLRNTMLQLGTCWSFSRNIRQGHKLAGYYLETMLTRRMCCDRNAAVLTAAILRKAKSTQGNKK